MFEQSFVSERRTKQPWTVFVAFLGQMLMIGVIVLIPLIYYQALPAVSLQTMLVAPPPPPPPPPPPAAVPQQPKVVHVQPTRELTQPRIIPKKVEILKEPEVPDTPAPTGVVGGVPGGVPGGTAGGVIGSVMSSVPTAAPPPPPPPPKPAAPQRIRVGGNVEAAKLINKVTPVYPPLAKSARVQGTVKLSAVIGKDGSIQNLSVISGHPLLVQAALQAVRQWRYAPTHLNGQPVEVVTDIDVNFQLGG